MRKRNRTAGGVTVRVKGKNTAITQTLHDQVVHKMARLDKYLDRLTEIEVELCNEKTREPERQNHVEATTHVLGRTIRVRAEGSEMHAAIDEAVDRLYRQLNRTKERIKAHHSPRLVDLLPVGEGELELAGEIIDNRVEPLEEEPRIVVEQLEMKPQFEDEAIEEMEALGRSFYVFLNARNETVNVLYRRSDGAYGLIEPGMR